MPLLLLIFFRRKGLCFYALPWKEQSVKAFVEYCIPTRFDGFSEIIQTDGGDDFEGEFTQVDNSYCARHRIARPYKKNEQAFIESFSRSLRKECLGWANYKAAQIPQLSSQVEHWLQYYHYERPHISLNMRPPLPTPGVTF